MKLSTLVLASAVIAMPLTGIAQTTRHERHHINARKENQQDRIAQGVNSGQLTARESSRLEHGEARINHQEADMREDDHGKLTARDRHTLAREQNRESRQIYKDKHNDAHQPGAPTL